MTDRSAGGLLTAVLADLGQSVRDGRAPALADDPDAVHQLRTIVRRVRNVLAAFGDCFEDGPADAFAAHLSAYGDLLGRSRDMEVRAADAGVVLDELGLADALGATVIAPLLEQHQLAHQDLVAWHASPDADAFGRQLGEWMTEPPLAASAMRPGKKVAAKAVRSQVRRVLARADRLERDGTEEAVHALRRAARRLRHTADAVKDVPGVHTVGVGALGQRIQGLLGDHRDALLLADHVRGCAADGADAASYERVMGRAEELATEAMAGLADALADLRGAPVP